MVDSYLTRTLDERFPELKPYLKSGLSVLDIGCGPGSITLDVARVVTPGQVVGIDPVQTRIDRASQLAEGQTVRNITFQVGDTLNLEFPDDTFDVVYSHTVLHSVIDPIRALQEQKRVAKPGGWVIAAGVREWGVSPRYPACPALAKALNAVKRYYQSIHKRYQSGQHELASLWYLDIYAGRKCPEWFMNAGLTNLTMQVNTIRMAYPGADGMDDPNYVLDGVSAPNTPDHPWSKLYAEIITDGYLDETTYQQAQQEIVEWYRHPHAFYFNWLATAAGKA